MGDAANLTRLPVATGSGAEHRPARLRALPWPIDRRCVRRGARAARPSPDARLDPCAGHSPAAPTGPALRPRGVARVPFRASAARSSRSRSRRSGGRPITSTPTSRRRRAPAPIPWRWARACTAPRGIRERGTCVSAIGGSVAVIAAVTRSSNPSELSSSRHSRSWSPRTSRRRPGHALTRAAKSSSSNAFPCATSPRQVIRSVGATLLVQARSMRSGSARGRRGRSNQIQVLLAGVSTVGCHDRHDIVGSVLGPLARPALQLGFPGLLRRPVGLGWRRRLARLAPVFELIVVSPPVLVPASSALPGSLSRRCRRSGPAGVY